MIETVANMIHSSMIIGMLILLANLVVLALNLKLYTEYFKDRKIERRKE